MKTLLSIAIALAAISTALGAVTKQRQETAFIFQNRKVLFDLPDGVGFNPSRNDQGLIVIRIADRKAKAVAEITFSPDADGQCASALHRRELMNELYSGYVGDSVEKAMEFQELEPKAGAGTYCTFTDARLVGRSDLPSGEYLHITAGVKSWPGVIAVFTLATNDTQSKEYRALFAMLRQSVNEAR